MVKAAAVLLALPLAAASGANPIRKVVNLLQDMSKTVVAQGEKEKDLYEKFMCYCKTGGSDLTGSITAAEEKLSSLASDIENAEAKHAATLAALKKAKDERASGEQAMVEATGIRKKEAGIYAQFKADSEANIAALAKATTAIENGMSGSFLQTGAANVLRKLLATSHSMQDDDHEILASFLEGGNQYAPQSQQIVGILKTMHDEFSEAFADATAVETAAINAYKELMAARLKEKAALTESIEAKLTKSGELGVAIAEMKNDQGDTAEALAADQKFLAELKKGCATKTGEWQARSKSRGEELVALADTIKILNDDDALELFKKTLPSASASLLQVAVTASSQRQRALEALRRGTRRTAPKDRTGLDLISMALHGKKIGFDKVIGMIDDMMVLLKKEQNDDDSKKEYCSEQLDTSDDEKKSLERDIGNLKASIATGEEVIATLTDEIAALTAGIAALDKSVAEATANRQAEHSEYNELIASDSAAKEVLGFAKNRLNKFYNPKLHVAAASAAFVQISEHVQDDAAPAPPPATWGAFSKMSQANGGVVQMINVLIGDLDKEMTEAKAEEKNAQAEYETLMNDSAEKRTADSKSLSEKNGAKADTQAAVEGHEDDKASATKELAATLKYIATLHAECDWLTKYFEVRKQARADELDALSNAKAALSGADYGF